MTELGELLNDGRFDGARAAGEAYDELRAFGT
jgi:hypothetical protein